MTEIDYLVPDAVVGKELGIKAPTMTFWRWDRDAEKIALGWPPKVKKGPHNYRHRSQVEIFKANLLKLALAERAANNADKTAA
jgi:hypothetical protein